MSKNGSITIRLKSLHATSSAFRPWYVSANYSAGKTVKNEVLGTCSDVFGNVFNLQMMYPSAKMLGRSRNLSLLFTGHTHVEQDVHSNLMENSLSRLEKVYLREIWPVWMNNRRAEAENSTCLIGLILYLL